MTLQPSESSALVSGLLVTPNFGDGSQGDEVEQEVRAPESVDNVSSHPSQFTVYNGELWFAAENSALGREWWKTDGTAAGTQLVFDLFADPAGSYPVQPLEFDQQLFFGAYGNQDLYRRDGTSTVLVAPGTGVNHHNWALVKSWGVHALSFSQPVFPLPS